VRATAFVRGFLRNTQRHIVLLRARIRRQIESAGGQAETEALLERCTRAFLGDERYRDDVRYLRVWLLHADCREPKEEVFELLLQHDIGQRLALYHVARATCLERCEIALIPGRVADKSVQRGRLDGR